jgi:hypothetical protein
MLNHLDVQSSHRLTLNRAPVVMRSPTHVDVLVVGVIVLDIHTAAEQRHYRPDGGK